MRMPASDLQNTLTYNTGGGTNVECSPTSISQPACTGSSGLIPYVGNFVYTFSTNTTTAGTVIEHMNHLSSVFQSTNQGTTTVSTPVQQMDCYVCHGNATAGSANGWSKGSFHKALITAGYLQPTQCLSCHAGDVPSDTQVNSFLHSTVGTQECSSCHNVSIQNIQNSVATPWYPAAKMPHPPSGTTAGSLLACESCHGGGSGVVMQNCSQANSGGGPCSLTYSDSAKVNPKNMNHNWSSTASVSGTTVYPNHFYDGQPNPTSGSSYCITCHSDFTSFGYGQASTGTVSLAYAHPGVGGGGNNNYTITLTTIGSTNYSTGYCINCHYFDSTGKYTAMTNYYSGGKPYFTFNTSFDVSGTGTATVPFAMLNTTDVGNQSVGGNGNLPSPTYHNSAVNGTNSTTYDCNNCHSYSAHTTISTKATQAWKTDHTGNSYGNGGSGACTNGCLLCHGSGNCGGG